MGRICLILLLIIFFGSLLMYNMHERMKLLEDQNNTLRDTLVNHLQAVKDKDERNEKELERLRRHLAELNSLSSEWRNTHLPADVINFLHTYTQDRNSPISAIVAK